MAPSDDVNLGPRTKDLLARSTWSQANPYPAHQSWADECEQLLAFLDGEGVFNQFLPRISANEWEGALAEARSAFYLKTKGFQITDWQPRAKPEIPGDLEIQWHDTERIFVEVKGPGWESELTQEELRAKRQRQPKYINAEARVVDPYESIAYAIGKAVPKFVTTRPNLVVVSDDFFFSPLEGGLRELLEYRVSDILSDSKFKIVSAVLLLKAISYIEEPGVRYFQYFVPNPNNEHPIADAAQAVLVAGNAVKARS